MIPVEFNYEFLFLKYLCKKKYFFVKDFEVEKKRRKKNTQSKTCDRSYRMISSEWRRLKCYEVVKMIFEPHTSKLIDIKR